MQKLLPVETEGILSEQYQAYRRLPNTYKTNTDKQIRFTFHHLLEIQHVTELKMHIMY